MPNCHPRHTLARPLAGIFKLAPDSKPGVKRWAGKSKVVRHLPFNNRNSLGIPRRKRIVIELFGMGSPNVRKVGIMLEELGLEYVLRHVAVFRGDQFERVFLALNPLGKVPVLIDPTRNPGRPIYESGAILFYLHRRKAGQPVTSSPGIPEPLINPRFDGTTLTFQVSHRRAHPPRTLNDPPVSFRLTLTGLNKGAMNNVSEPVGDGSASSGLPMVRTGY